MSKAPVKPIEAPPAQDKIEEKPGTGPDDIRKYVNKLAHTLLGTLDVAYVSDVNLKRITDAAKKAGMHSAKGSLHGDGWVLHVDSDGHGGTVASIERAEARDRPKTPEEQEKEEQDKKERDEANTAKLEAMRQAKQPVAVAGVPNVTVGKPTVPVGKPKPAVKPKPTAKAKPAQKLLDVTPDGQIIPVLEVKADGSIGPLSYKGDSVGHPFRGNQHTLTPAAIREAAVQRNRDYLPDGMTEADLREAVSEGKPILDIATNSHARGRNVSISGSLGVLHPNLGYIEATEPKTAVWSAGNKETQEAMARSFAKRTFGHTAASEIEMRHRSVDGAGVIARNKGF